MAGKGGCVKKPDSECDPAYVKRRQYFLDYIHSHREQQNANARKRRAAAGSKPRGSYGLRGNYKKKDSLDEIAMRDPIIAQGRPASQ